MRDEDGGYRPSTGSPITKPRRYSRTGSSGSRQTQQPATQIAMNRKETPDRRQKRNFMTMRNILLAAAAAILTSLVSRAAELSSRSAAQRISRYDVVWNTPSKDASGQMPIGNGNIAAGVYAIENGDLYLLLAKNDAYTYQGDLFKTGRVRISLDPNPFKSGKPFRQTLDLPTGSVRIEADGVTLRIWADAHRHLAAGILRGRVPDHVVAADALCRGV